MNREYERHVRICVYNTMPNHFHIKLMPNFEDGCEKFMHKLEMAYSKYCNPKLQRKGRLFQGTYEAVHVTNDFQWFHLSNYIHGNSLDLCMPEWRDGLVEDWEQARAFLRQHSWSSLPAFLGVPERFPILDSEYKRQRFEKTEDVLRELEEWSRRGIQIHDIPGIEFE